MNTSATINELQSENLSESKFLRNDSNRISIDDISSIELIYDLTIRQLKTILTQNFVTISGCVEKQELINKVILLYEDKKQQKESKTNSKRTFVADNFYLNSLFFKFK